MRAPILILGLGNLLLGDDGAGLEMLSVLRGRGAGWGDTVDFVDGGTQGLALLGEISERRTVVLLDAVRTGAVAGTVHLLRTDQLLAIGSAQGTATAHDANAIELIRAAVLLGESVEEWIAIGIEPQTFDLGIALSDPVQRAIEPAVALAFDHVERSRAFHSIAVTP